MDFSFNMLGVQFAFTKNFNKYVDAYYAPSLSWIEAGNFTDQLIRLANLDFDIVELYARKFRKQMYDNKKTTSNINFYNDLYKEVSAEYKSFQAEIQNEIRTTNNLDSLITQYHLSVNEEIIALEEFCKQCKPKKKKRRK